MADKAAKPSAPRAGEPARVVPTPPPVDVTAAGGEESTRVAPPPPRAVWYAVLAAVVIGFGIWLAVRPSPPTPPTAASSPPVSQAAAEPSAAPIEPAPSPVAAPEPSAVASAVPATDGGDAITVLLKIRPEGARVYYRGKEVGRSPFTLELPRGETRAYEVGHPGYMTRRLVVDGNEPVISLSMAPAPAPGGDR